MSRVGIVAVLAALAFAANATPAKRPTPAAAKKTVKKPVLEKTTAKKPSAKKPAAKRVGAKALAKKQPVRRGKHARGKRVATAEPRPRVKTTAKPLVSSAKLQLDGRVKYGADHLPPGFAWPPTTSMAAVGKACEQELDVLGVKWKPAPTEGMVADPIVVPSMQIGGVTYASAFRRPTPPTMDCQFVRALALLGPDLYALGVREVQFGSVYRNTLARSHGQTKDFLSRHALGIAMDIKSFVDDSGRVATVETDYLKDDPLLHGIEDMINARTQFRQVLTPGNDPISHDDHFHIEASVDFTAFR